MIVKYYLDNDSIKIIYDLVVIDGINVFRVVSWLIVFLIDDVEIVVNVLNLFKIKVY